MNGITTWIAGDRPRNSLPAWARTIVQSWDGPVFVPAALGGNENHTVLCAAREGETLMRCRGHANLRAEWMRWVPARTTARNPTLAGPGMIQRSCTLN